MVWFERERERERAVAECDTNFPTLNHLNKKDIINDICGSNNIFIEGDNYHALMCLNYTHREKIGIIYIDPPYNTGNNDFKFNDVWVQKEDCFRHSK
jgi:adenine-specific DNA-methyltransferase